MENKSEMILSAHGKPGNGHVLAFIRQFLLYKAESSVQEMFLNKYCYYFATILKEAFSRGAVCLAAPLTHIVWVDDDGVPYDANGVFSGKVKYLIPVSYMGDTLNAFKMTSEEDNNVSNDDIARIVEVYLEDHHELKPKEKSTLALVDEFDRPLPDNELLKNSVLQKNGKYQVFYHGTNDEDFERFDERFIGMANDLGWYGRGFYFCYTRSEARFYGRYVREACLAMANPFYFNEELMEMKGQHTSIVGDMAVFAVNLKQKFPSLAAKLSVSVVGSFDEEGKGVGVKRLLLSDYADIVMSVFQDPNFEVYECWDQNVRKYYYKMGEDYNAIRQEFRTMKEALEYRLDMAATYVMRRKYAHVGIHMPEYFMEQVSEEFTNELKDRGYDGVLQSEYGDEAICFDADQIVFCQKEEAQ